MNKSFQFKLQSLNFPPKFFKVADLVPNKPYKIVSISELPTIYGVRVIADIQSDEGIKRIILPQRFQNLLEDLEEINSVIDQGKNCFLTYKGKLGNSGDVTLTFD